MILENFECEKFINEKFHTLRVSKDMILLHLEYTLLKNFKRIYRIEICRDIISLNINKCANNIKKYVDNIKEDITLYIDGERIMLKISQTQV